MTEGDFDCPLTVNTTFPTRPVQHGWSWVLLKHIARLATGHTPSRRNLQYWGGDIPWLQLPDIRVLDGKTAFATIEYTNLLGIENSSAVLLPTGTVCLSRTASVGFVTVLGKDMATSQDFVNWVCGSELNPHFLMWLFIASRKFIKSLGSGATHHTIYFPTVKSFAVCIPPLAEQVRIVAELTASMASVETARLAAHEQLRMVQALPAALLREVFGSVEA